MRTIRNKLGLTQKQLAEKLGTHWNTLARWERDEVPIREAVARLIRLTAAQQQEVKGS